MSFQIRIMITAFLVLWAKTSTTSADTCTFENGQCDQWVSSDCSQGACFEVRKVADMKHGPTVDHTTHTEEGSCAYATTGTATTGTASSGGTPVATLLHKAQGPLCFTAWYHQFGTDRSQVAFSIERDNGESSDFYASQPEAAGRWHRVRYSENHAGKAEIRVRFHGSDTPERTSLALDDLTVESGECPPEPKDGSCDFDWGETCGYSFDQSRTLWKLGDRREGFFLPDYSSGGMLGGVAYLEASGLSIHSVLSSPQLPGRLGVQCLRFHYYISDISTTAQNHEIRVARAVGSQRNYIWQRSHEELIRGAWTAVDLAFKEEKDFSMVFACYLKAVNTPGKVYCAIDDIRLDDCNGKRVPGDRRCDFEDGWCTWKNRENTRNKFVWQLAGGDAKTTLERPSLDKTYENASGSYLFLSNYERKNGDAAEIIGEVLPPVSLKAQCLTFWSCISGDSDTRLQVLSLYTRLPSHRSLPLWTELGNDQVTWMMGRVAVPPGSRVIFRGTVGPASKPAYIGLDDISIDQSRDCGIVPHGANKLLAGDLLSCQFDGGDLCYWTSEGGLSGRWTLGPPAGSPLGPLLPPDDAEGGMIHANGSTLEKNRGFLQLSSHTVSQQELACLSFWYHMFGGEGVQLLVNVKTADSGKHKHWRSLQLFERRGRTTVDRWYNVRRTVSLYGQENKIEIALKFLDISQVAAVIALGPIDVTPGACDVLTDAKGYCNFEFDACGWVDANGWGRQTRLLSLHDPDQHARSGPVSSVFVLATTPTSCVDSDCTVKSPMWTGQSEPQCLEFWYLPPENKDAQLKAEVVVNGKSENLWSMPVHMQREWTLARVQFVQQERFQVLFRARLTAQRFQSFSLDDVALRPEPCVNLVECNFTDGFCGYVNKFQGDFRWLVGTGRLENPSLQPAMPIPADASSSFAYLDLTTGRKDNWPIPKSRFVKSVSLLSAPFDVNNEQQKIVFRYFRNGPDIVAANVSVVCYADDASPRGETQHSQELDEVSEWTTVNVPLKRGTNCRLAIQVIRGESTNGAMAVDSIQLVSVVPDVRPGPGTDSATRCTFEDGTMCGWNSEGGSLKWMLNDPANGIPAFPRSDHTVRAYRGRFIFAENKNAKLENVALNSPQLDVNGTSGLCLSFWHFATNEAPVSISVVSGGQPFVAVTQTRHRWEHALLDINGSSEPIELQMRMTLQPGLFALDDLQITAGICPERDFCSWEKDSLCKFYQGQGNVFSWRIRRADKVGLPDRTTGTLQGYYLYLNTTALDSHHPVSRTFMGRRQPTKATCVTFWWKAQGAPSQLSVYRFTRETALRDAMITLQTEQQGDWWNARSVTVSSKNRWNLVFEVIAPAGNKRPSGVMLDDVEFTDGECPPYNLCTFEDECLPWRVPIQGNNARFDVERAGSFIKLPQDHTTLTDNGYYMLYKSPGVPGNRTSLQLREPSLYRCVSLWYYLPTLSDGVQLHLQGRIAAPGNVWKKQEFRPSFRGRVIPVEAVSGSSAEGFVAIDDVLIDEAECQNELAAQDFQCGDSQTVPTEKVCDFVPDCNNSADEHNCGPCDFSVDACGWKLDDARNQGTTAWCLERVGYVPQSPTFGATGLRSGHYILLYGNKTRSPEHGRASISSPTIRNTNKLCAIEFWYNFAKNGASLDVELYMTVGVFTMAVWSLGELSRVPKEGVWTRAFVDVGRYPRDVSFSFSTNQYPQAKAMFAVDAILYTGCALPAKQDKCSDDNFQCANGACVNSYHRCNYVDDCGDNSDERDCGDHRLGCSFDTSFCDWAPDTPSEGNWASWTLSSPSSFLSAGPTRDHTTGTHEGKFLIFKSSLSQRNATIVGPTLHNKQMCMITFFYTVQGRSEPLLSLNVRTTKDGPWKRVWEQRGTTELFHFTAHSFIIKQSEPYQIAFTGEHRKAGQQGYIAIDDVTFSESCKPHHGVLPPAPTVTPAPFTCGKEEFQCADSAECIPQTRVCDFKSDCSNGADEARCGACEFSTDLCGLENEYPNARFGWSWTTVEDAKRAKFFPKTDSRLSEDGAYAVYSLLNQEVPHGGIDKAMITPRLGPIAHSCVVTFYASVPDDPSSTLFFGVLPPTVYDTSSASVALLAGVRGSNLNGRWTEVTVKTGNWDAGSRFFYLANTRGISVDRPTYSNCHPDAQSEGWEAARQVSCDFSNTADCGWFPERRDADLDWVLQVGTNATGNSRFRWQPPDSASGNGAYMYARNKLLKMKTAHLVSVQMGPTPVDGRCFSFWYNMWHPNGGDLNLLERVGNASTTLLWRRTAPQGKAWQQGQAQLHCDDPHQLVFEGVLNPRTLGSIAIDHFTLKDGRCDSGTGCTFEQDTCEWELYNWVWTKSSSISLPEEDHTTRAPSGSFALAQSPSGRMVSPHGWYDDSQDKCLRFWFFIAGTAAEKLNVTRELDDGYKEESIWFETAVNLRMNIWYSAAVNLVGHLGRTLTVFEGSTSGEPGTAVAVDDIAIGDVACPPPGSCSFEEDMCNWYNNRGRTYAQWYRHKGRTASLASDLEKDHTLGTAEGYYLLLDSEDMSSVGSGSLQSQTLSLGPVVCLQLYYHMRKGTFATLNIAFLDPSGIPTGQNTVASAPESSEWTLLSVERSDLPPVFSILITAPATKRTGNIAIDDIDVRPVKCTPDTPGTTTVHRSTMSSRMPPTTPLPDEPSTAERTEAPETEWPTSPTKEDIPIMPTTAPPTPAPPKPKPGKCLHGQFDCRDGATCIPALLLCDGVRDCLNGLDEKCGQAAQCREDQFYCASQDPFVCVPRTFLCDDHDDCFGGADEFMCGVCPEFLCQNGGSCSWTEYERSPVCNCSEGYKGSRCQFNAEPAAHSEAVRGTRIAASVVTSIVVVSIFAIIGAFAAFVILRRRRANQRQSEILLNTAAYDPSMEETQFM